MMTSSPGSRSAKHTLKMECLAPLETMICEGSYSRPLSRANLSQMARRSSGRPAAGVYLVQPRSRASSAALMMCSGVLKSGSPTPKLTTSSPAAFIAFALALIASVSEGEMVRILFASLSISYTSLGKIVWLSHSPAARRASRSARAKASSISSRSPARKFSIECRLSPIL